MCLNNTASDILQVVDFKALRNTNTTGEQRNHLRVALHNNLDFQDLHLMNGHTFILCYEHTGLEFSLVIDCQGVQRIPQHYLISIVENEHLELLYNFKEVL